MLRSIADQVVSFLRLDKRQWQPIANDVVVRNWTQPPREELLTKMGPVES